MATPFQTFKTRLGIGSPTQKGTGFDYTPTILQQGQSPQQVGQKFLDTLGQRKDTGQQLYNTQNQNITNRLASDLVNKSAGLKLDQFGQPTINLADFGTAGQTALKSTSQRGQLATDAAVARQQYRTAAIDQNIGSYGFSSYSGSDVPGASTGNVGAQVAAKAMKMAAAHTTPYVWGGNSLVNGVDCSGLVQQLYGQLGIAVPRTTYEQAKSGKKVSIHDIRPGDLVFYNKYGHVGIYVGNGKIVHAANSRLGIITSNLTNSNGSPLLVLRPY